MARFDFDRSDIHVSYDDSRRLPQATLARWLEALSRHVDPEAVDTVVDVGCGTGRFARGLAEHFGATVCGVDPSGNMLAAAQQGSGAGATLVRGEAEALPLRDDAADLVFLSMVYHHLRDTAAAAREFGRVLRPGGFLAIRNSVRERLDSYLWLRFFPAARVIEFDRVPSCDGLIASPSGNGFALQAHAVVRHPFADNLRHYAEKIGLRGLSSLKAIADDEFEQGMADLREYCRRHDTGEPVFEDIDLFVFRLT